MRTRAVLARIKQELDSIDPPIGKVFAQLRKSPEQEDVTADYLFKDPQLGDVLKAFIIRPGDSRISRGSTGRNGFSLRLRNIVIQGFISFQAGTKKTGEDLVLEDAFDTIVDTLQKLQRLETKSQGDAFSSGEMTMTPILAAKVSNKNVLAATLTVVIEDRILGVPITTP